MGWNVHKCAELLQSEALFLAGSELPSSEETEYLGVSIRKGGIGYTTLLDWIKTARQSLFVLMRVTKNWNIDPAYKLNYA